MRLAPLLCAVATLLGLALQSAPAHAQATRTWVSGVGDDANPCSRTAPCKTFAGAISKTAAGGIINCLDPGGFGTVTITKAMTIDCTGTQAGALASSTNGININVGVNDKVTLRNLDIEGAGSTPGFKGVNVLQAGSVLIDQCRIFGFKSSPASGVYVATSQPVELHVKDSIIYDNGAGGVGGGIVLVPTGGTVRAALSRVELRDSSAYGILAAGSGNSTIRLQGTEVVIAGNSSDGVRALASSGSSFASLFFERASINNNLGYGAVAEGNAAHLVFGRSVVAFNNVGMAVSGGGTIWSYGNNHINANVTADGGPTAAMVPD